MFYNTDTLFLSEGFLDSCIEACGPDISIPGYNSLRSDHPLNTKRGGVRMFSKHYLLVLRCHDLCVLADQISRSYWNQIGEKSTFFTCNYRSADKIPHGFENLWQNFHLTLSKTDDTSKFCSIRDSDGI